jgi:hypothetical protein
VKIFTIIPPAIPSAGVYYFVSDSGMKYEVRFGRKQNDLLSATIVFGVTNDEFEGEEYVMTNKGEVYSVMNTIIKVIEMYRKEHPNVRSYEFSGEPQPGESVEKPTKRLKLYNRYVLKMFSKEDWKVDLQKNKLIVYKTNLG